jgi:hypothetical protein
MTWNQFELCSVEPRYHARALAAVCISVFCFAGCAERRPAKSAWNNAGMARPHMPAIKAPHPQPPTDETVDPVPELRLELPPPPPLLAVEAVPMRPHVAPARAPENNVASKPEAPVIAPQMSTAEINAARQQMTVSLTAAETNLGRAQGRSLNSTQADLASKIKGFIGDARSAEKEEDWTRARSLATKAQVLSEELASSL